MKMMKKAGFTLVELIVVITILAILGTIAFISLQGNTQDAKNSKVTSDLRTLASSIEIATTREDASLSGIWLTNGTINVTNNGVTSGTDTAFNGVTLTGATNYNVGTVNFTALKQNGADFLDPSDNPYIYAYAFNGGDAYYQLAGQITEASGNVKAYTKGNYVEEATGDVDGLITPARDAANAATTVPLEIDGTTDLGTIGGGLY